MSHQIRLLLADDHSIVRRGLASLLSTEPDIDVVGEAANGREAVEMVDRLRPDVILMDLEMPEMDGIEAISAIMQTHPDSRILILTTFATDEKVFPAIKAGGLGYLLKDADTEELIKAIHQVARGEPAIHPTIARKMLEEISRPPTGPLASDPLTEREVEVLRLVAQGRSNAEIAEVLVISVATARSHVGNILGKLHLASRTQAALYALREGLASLEDTGEIT